MPRPKAESLTKHNASDHPSELEPEEVRRLALRFLAARALTRIELMRKLTSRGASEDAATLVVDDYVERGFLVESEIAEDGVRIGVGKSLGRGMVRRKLLARGLPEELVETEIERQIDPESEFDAAFLFAQKKFKSLVKEERDVQIRRIGGALGRRGFSSGLIQRALRELGLVR